MAAQEVPDPHRPVVRAGGEFIISRRETGDEEGGSQTCVYQQPITEKTNVTQSNIQEPLVSEFTDPQ